MPNKAIPAPKVVVPENTRETILWISTAIAIIVAIASIVSIARAPRHVAATYMAPKQPNIPLADRPVHEWPTFTLPPGGKSVRILIPHGVALTANGHKFRLYTVYRDGRECFTSSGDTQPCPDGPVVAGYIVNEAQETNIVSYAFLPSNARQPANPVQQKPKGAKRSKESAEKRKTACPDVSVYETRGCLIDTRWSNWIKTENGAILDGKRLCVTSGLQWDIRDKKGIRTWRFKVADGQIAIQYRLYPASELCPAVLP